LYYKRIIRLIRTGSDRKGAIVFFLLKKDCFWDLRDVSLSCETRARSIGNQCASFAAQGSVAAGGLGWSARPRPTTVYTWTAGPFKSRGHKTRNNKLFRKPSANQKRRRRETLTTQERKFVEQTLSVKFSVQSNYINVNPTDLLSPSVYTVYAACAYGRYSK